MSKSPEDKIEEKLRQLEVSMKEDNSSNLPASVGKSSSLSSGSNSSAKTGKILIDKQAEIARADKTLLTGFIALVVGIVIMFSNLRVSSGWGSLGGLFGGGGTSGQGLFLLLLVVGIGFFFYDHKNKIGWGCIFGGIAGLFVSICLTMHVYFQSMSMWEFLIMVLPIAFGAGLIAKASKRHAEIEQDSKD